MQYDRAIKKTLDRDFCHSLPGEVGPVETKLHAYDPVRGLVFGARGEASPDVERLISQLAAKGAVHFWKEMRAASPVEARGALAWMLRRRIARTVLRENARLKLERMEQVGRGAAAAIDRRRAQHLADAPRS